MKDAGFKSPPEHEEIKTTVGQKKYQYDRIFVKERKDKFKILKGGKIEIFKNLFLESETKTYKNLVKKQDGSAAKKFTQWRTHQLSDHEPLWVEFQIEFEAEYLNSVIEKNKKSNS